MKKGVGLKGGKEKEKAGDIAEGEGRKKEVDLVAKPESEDLV